MLLTVLMFARSRRSSIVSGPEEMIGSTGTVIDWSDNAGNIRVHGEIWRAQAKEPLAPGNHIEVTEIDGLTLIVEPETNRR
jgi:membrane-bound serine protease (ClpP class)